MVSLNLGDPTVMESYTRSQSHRVSAKLRFCTHSERRATTRVSPRKRPRRAWTGTSTALRLAARSHPLVLRDAGRSIGSHPPGRKLSCTRLAPTQQTRQVQRAHPDL